jgi:hypothetical protein
MAFYALYDTFRCMLDPNDSLLFKPYTFQFHKRRNNAVSSVTHCSVVNTLH